MSGFFHLAYSFQVFILLYESVHLSVFFNPHPRICLLILEREEGREGEREKEKHCLVASCVRPDRELNPQTFCGIQTTLQLNYPIRTAHISFHGWITISLYGDSSSMLHIHSLVSGHLGRCHIWAIMNSAVTCADIFCYLESTTRTGIAGVCGNWMFEGLPGYIPKWVRHLCRH